MCSSDLGRAFVLDLVDYQDEGRGNGTGCAPISLCCVQTVPAWALTEKRTC